MMVVKANVSDRIVYLGCCQYSRTRHYFGESAREEMICRDMIMDFGCEASHAVCSSYPDSYGLVESLLRLFPVRGGQRHGSDGYSS